MNPSTCSLCEQPAQITFSDTSRGVDSLTCERCGQYEITDELKHFTSQLAGVERYLLSGLCRELFETGGKPPILMTHNLNELLQQSQVPKKDDIRARLEKLLAAVKRKSDHFGKSVELSRDTDYPLAYAKNDEEFFAFIDQLVAMGLLELRTEDSRTKFVVLSATSWGQPSSVTTDEEESNGEIGFRTI